MKNLILLTLLLTHSASATIWITVADPKSQKIGVVGASSGLIGDERTMVAADNHGIAVVGSWYLDRDQKHLVRLIKSPHLSATEVVREFGSLINQDAHKRRVSFVNARFENASEPGRGCHQDNVFCGDYEENSFSVSGGGLVSEDVIMAARNVLQDPSTQTLPIECQLFKSIEAVFRAGGELKQLERLAFMVDNLTISHDVKSTLFHRQGQEASLLEKFAQRLRSQGIHCQ